MLSRHALPRVTMIGDIRLTVDFDPADHEGEYFEFPIRVCFCDAATARRVHRVLAGMLSGRTERLAHEFLLEGVDDLPLLLLLGGVEQVLEMLPVPHATSKLEGFFGIPVQQKGARWAH